MVTLAAGVMRSTKQLQQTLDTLYVVVKEQIDTVENKTREVMAKLEERINESIKIE